MELPAERYNLMVSNRCSPLLIQCFVPINTIFNPHFDLFLTLWNLFPCYFATLSWSQSPLEVNIFMVTFGYLLVDLSRYR